MPTRCAAPSGSASARTAPCRPAAPAGPRRQRGSAGERRRILVCARQLLGAAPRGAGKRHELELGGDGAHASASAFPGGNWPLASVPCGVLAGGEGGASTATHLGNRKTAFLHVWAPSRRRRPPSGAFRRENHMVRALPSRADCTRPPTHTPGTACASGAA
eukprot:scaffold3377_cov105-Isochrysis_galbana.AAC.11